jgi:pheromone shutdown protein TraB
MRSKISKIDWLASVVPFVVWMVLGIMFDGGKSLSNIVECIWIAFVSGILTLISSKYAEQKPVKVIYLILCCIVAVSVSYFTPPLPE